MTLTDKQRRNIRDTMFNIFGYTPNILDVGTQLHLQFGGAIEVSFAALKRVSEIFKTDKIDVNKEMQQGGYCETCSYEYEETTLILQDWNY